MTDERDGDDDGEKEKEKGGLTPVLATSPSMLMQDPGHHGTGFGQHPIPGVNIAFGSMPAEIALIKSLPPDLQKQVLDQSNDFANRNLALQEKQLDKAFDAEERDKGRAHSKWKHLYWFVGLFMLVAITGVVALYVAGKDAAAEKFGLGLLSFVGGVLAGWGFKSAKDKSDKSAE